MLEAVLYQKSAYNIRATYSLALRESCIICMRLNQVAPFAYTPDGRGTKGGRTVAQQLMWSPTAGNYRGQASDGTVVIVDQEAMQLTLSKARSWTSRRTSAWTRRHSLSTK